MALAEERPLDVLALLARTRGRDVPRTDGLLLVAMEAAASLEDWGGVARLYSELTDGPEEAAKLAVALESFGSAAVLEELQRPRAREHDSPARSPETQRALALTLALRAHAERGDVSAATEVAAAPGMPQGTKREKASRLVVRFSAAPCMETPRLMRMPTAASLPRFCSLFSGKNHQLLRHSEHATPCRLDKLGWRWGRRRPQRALKAKTVWRGLV
jgi:hypothetical protein